MALEKIGVEAVIEGLSSFRSGIGGMEKDVSGFGRVVGGTLGPLGNMGDSLLKVGGIAAGAVVAGLSAATAGLTAFAVGGIKAAIDMEDQMGTIAATMNTTKSEIQPLADLIIDLGVDPGLKVSAEEAASAIELLARNGLTMTEIVDGAAKSTVLLANATGAEFGNAADIATDAMSIFGIEASKMDSAVNSIVSVTTNSKFTIDDFSLAIRNGGAAAAMMNVSLDDFNTVIAATAEEMGSGMRAGTGFRNFLTRLTPSSDGAADAMKELGLVTSAGTNMFFDANGQLKSMAEVSGILQDALYGTSTAIVEVGGRTAEQNKELSRLQGIYSRTLTSINDYELGIKGVGLSEEARAKKIEDLNLQLSNTMAAMGPLNAIQGEFVESTKQLTDAERSAALELIFGQDALGTAIGLANEGEESFRALAGSMSETDAAAMALERMDSVAGVLEILGGVIDTVKLQIGQAFLPLVRDLADAFLGISEDVGPKIVLFFGEISTFISEFIRGLQATGDPISAFMEGLDNILPEATISEIWDFIDAVDEVISTVSEFVSTHAEAFKGAIAGIGAVLGSSVIVSVITAIVGVLGAILSPIGLIIAAAAALGAAWQSNFGGIQEIVKGVYKSILLLATGDFSGGIFGLTEDAPFISGLLSARDAITGVVNSVKLLITGDFNGGIFGLTEDEPFIVALLNARQTIFDFKDAIIELGTRLAPIGGLFVAFGNQIAQSFSSGGIQGAIDQFIALWPGIVAAVQVAIDQILVFVGQKIGVDLLGIFNNVQVVVTSVFTFISAFISSIVATLGPTIQEMMSGIGQALTSLQPAGEQLMTLFQTIAPIIGGVLLGLVGVVIGVVNGIIAAINPLIVTFGIVLNGVLTVVNGVIAQFGAMRDFIVAVFSGSSDDMSAAWNAMKENSLVIIQGLVDIVAGLFEGLGITVVAFAKGLYEGVVGFFTNLYDELVGNSIVVDLVEDIIKLIIGFKNDFIELINTLVGDAADEFRKFVKEIEGMASDMKEAGKNIIQGLIDGIKQKVSDAVAAVVGAVNSVVNAAKAAAGVESPSKIFAEIGENLGLGLIVGIEKVTKSVQESMVSLFDIGGKLGSIGNSFAQEMEKTIIGPAKEAAEIASKKVEHMRGKIAQKVGIEFEELTDRKVIELYFEAIHSGNQDMLDDIKNLWWWRGKEAEELDKAEEAQRKIFALQKAQKDLAFLEQQQKLLDLITEHGLDASEILNGMKLGLGADTQGLVEAMTRAIQAIVDQTKAQLEIASPSGVFQRIGEFVTSGLAHGIAMGATQPEMAMDSMLTRMTQPVQALPSVSLQSQTVTNSREAQLNFGDTIINNDTDVQAFRDFILRTVRDNI